LKRSILIALVAATFSMTACTSSAHAADSKDFPIKVHVSSSELKFTGGLIYQINSVLIDGKKYELEHHNKLTGIVFPLHPGDYQARIVKNEEGDEGQFEREYEILFADGKTLKYRVVGEFE